MQSLMDLAKLFGWIAEKREDFSAAERLSRMTDEQKLEEAKALSAKVRAMLARERGDVIEGEAVEVED